jgi:hypothetical protein
MHANTRVLLTRVIKADQPPVSYPTMVQPTLTATDEQERLLIWGDIRHLYHSCGGGSDNDWGNEDLQADPAWREMDRLLRITASRKWSMPM